MNENQLHRVKEILAKNDPMGLIAEGAPNIEYDNLAEVINTFLQSNITETVLADKIYEIFLGTFYQDPLLVGEREIYKNLARELLETIRK